MPFIILGTSVISCFQDREIRSVQLQLCLYVVVRLRQHSFYFKLNLFECKLIELAISLKKNAVIAFITLHNDEDARILL